MKLKESQTWQSAHCPVKDFTTLGKFCFATHYDTEIEVGGDIAKRDIEIEVGGESPLETLQRVLTGKFFLPACNTLSIRNTSSGQQEGRIAHEISSHDVNQH